jgi:hypothetical protein
MMPKSPLRGNDSADLMECACAYPSCTIAVGRARLLYGLLHSTGMDEMNEIKAIW